MSERKTYSHFWFAFDISTGLTDPISFGEPHTDPATNDLSEAGYQRFPLHSNIAEANGEISNHRFLASWDAPRGEAVLPELPSRLSLYIQTIEALGPLLLEVDSRLFFFSSANGSSWVGSTFWKANPDIHFPRGYFDLNQLRQHFFNTALTQQGEAGFDLWSSILQTEPDSEDTRLLIFSAADSSAKALHAEFFTLESFLKVRLPCLSASLVLVGNSPDSESIQTLHQFFTGLGGIVFPSISSLGAVRPLIDALTEHFFFEDERILQQRKEHSLLKRSILQSDSSTVLNWKIAKRLNPSSQYCRCLAMDTASLKWRWMRGFRFYRENFKGVRDVFFNSPGPLGLEFSPPYHESPWWTLRSTHPPSSSLDLEEGSILFSVNGVILDPDVESKCFRLMMLRRPLVLSFTRKGLGDPGNCRSTWIRSCSEELAMNMILQDTADIYSTTPPDFLNVRQQPWNRIPTERFPLSQRCLLIASTIMCDIEALFVLSRVNTTFRRLFFPVESSEISIGRKLVRFALRRARPESREALKMIPRFLLSSACVNVETCDVLMRVSYGISIAEIFARSADVRGHRSPFVQFCPEKLNPSLRLIQGVTAACFIHSPVLTRRLVADGVPLELLFAEFLLRISLGARESSVSELLQALSYLEEPGSIFWLRLFLALLDRLSVSGPGNLFSNSFKVLVIDSVDALTVQAANVIPVSYCWLRLLLRF